MAESEKALDLVRKLINLAASTNLAEAKNAAYKACAMIRKAGLDVCDPAEIDAIYGELAGAQQKVRELEAGTDDDDDFIGVGFPFTATGRYPPPRNPPPPRPNPSATNAAAAAAAAFQSQYTGGGWASVPPPGGTARQYTYSPGSPAPTPAAPVALKASLYDGRCKQCSTKIRAGDPAWWLKGIGIFCKAASCVNDWTAARATGSRP